MLEQLVVLVVVHDTLPAVAPPYPITVSKASKLTYNDHGISHSWEGGNGLSSPFVYRDGANKQQAIEVQLQDLNNGLLPCRPFFFNLMNERVVQAPLKDRMIVYIGVAIVLLFSMALYSWNGLAHEYTPFHQQYDNEHDMLSDSMDMNDNGMDMNKQEMNGMTASEKSGIITKILTWMPPMEICGH